MKILIIGKVWPEPKSSAAGKRMKQLIELFKKKGEVHFACANTSTGNELDLAQLGVIAHTIELNNDKVNHFFSELSPEIVIFDRFLTEEQYGWRIMETCPNALRILNTEDLHFLRKTREEYVRKEQKIATDLHLLDFSNDYTMRELASIYRSDLSIIISKVELGLLVNELNVPQELLIYLPLFIENTTLSSSVSWKDKSDFLFIGNNLHKPNVDAVQQLVTSIWPRIHNRLPQSRLIIAGAYPNQSILRLENKELKIHVVGHVKAIDELYSTVRVSLVPLRFGAGIKGKIIETAEQGVPFIATSIGVEGMLLDNQWDQCVSDDWDEFVEKAISLFQNELDLSHFQKLNNEHLQSLFNLVDFEPIFMEQVEELLDNMPSFRQRRYYSQLIQHHTLMSTKYLSKWIMEKNKTKG